MSREAERKIRLQVTADVVTALDDFTASRVLAERYEEGLLAKATTVLETAQYAYRSGATSLLDLLTAIRTYADVKTEYLTVTHDYWVSAYALSRAVGRELIPD